MNKTRQINIRITEKDYNFLSMKATEAKMSLSKYIRETSIYASYAKKTIDKLKEELRYYKNMALARTKWLEDEE